MKWPQARMKTCKPIMSSSLSARVATPSQEGPLKTTHESQHQTEVPSHALGAEMVSIPNTVLTFQS